MEIQRLSSDSNSESILSPEIRVIDYWHVIEFFNPYDMTHVTDSKDHIPITFSYLEANKDLPWHNPSAYPDIGYYDLYFLPFKKNELSKASALINLNALSDIEKIDFEERFDEDEGETCFAKLRLTSYGTVASLYFSVSTLPWALGQLQLGKFDHFSISRYEADKEKLDQALNIIDCYVEQLRPKEPQEDSEEINQFREMQGTELLTIIHALLNWSQFDFESDIALYIVPKQIKKPQKTKLIASAHCNEDSKELVPQNNDQDEEEEDFEDEAQLAILNSFFIDDLERVRESLLSPTDNNEELKAYLLGQDQKKIDVYAPTNQSFIIEKLSPQYMNKGRWPSDSKHNMSLMQQLVIHEVFHSDNSHKLFSVNGPPGTGKTTLLQDIIAENIVKRAEVLARFTKAADAFIDKKAVSFRSGESRSVWLLDSSLLGFEMLVASSNNTAVENITKDLVLPKKVANDFTDECTYLAPVARMVKAARKKDAQLEDLKPEASPWGLISVALGKKKNGQVFKGQVFFAPEKDKTKGNIRRKKGQYLTIWEWLNHYSGPSFKEAKISFLETLEEYQQANAELLELSALHKLLGPHTGSTWCQQEMDDVTTAEEGLKTTEIELAQMQHVLNELELEKQKVNKELECLSLQSPKWFDYIFNRKKIKLFNHRYESLHTHWIVIVEKIENQEKKILGHNLTLESLKVDLKQKKQTLLKKQEEFYELQNQYKKLHQQFDSIVLPPDDYNLESDEAQENAFWQCPRINKTRSDLFIRALKLHEAWLVESGFKDTLFAISEILSGKVPLKKDDELLIWQNFFMWIPVVSSTFASIARQFKRVGYKALGWVLIDEAGQAIPQAAVGAIWRGKNIVIVGDPLQIEPVVTIPPPLIYKFAERYLPDNPEKWMPLTTSAQVLADQANCIGAFVENNGQKQWIGCPLRVHRRCIDPMFEISNQIAYMGKMINARVASAEKSKTHTCLGDSCWFDLTGMTVDKQYVEEHGQFILQTFIMLYEEFQGLPSLYIITPFKKIKMKLQEILINLEHWKDLLRPTTKTPTQFSLEKWAREHIGTVHTFQGKEKDAVIFVLGVDHENQGAANWASSKPNLLNVALTRAQNHFYVVGSKELWGQKPYFELLAYSLPVKTVKS